MQIITSTGYGDSGSSAITDLLSEYEGIKTYSSEYEFTFLHTPDGLGDLENAIREGHRLKCDFAINRFLELSKELNKSFMYINTFKGKFYELSKEFIEELCQIKWNGMYGDRLTFFYNSLSKKEKKLIDYAEITYTLNKYKKFDLYESDSWRPSYRPCAEMYYCNDIEHFYECAKKFTHKLFEIAADGNERLYLDQLLPPTGFNKYSKYFSDQVKLFVVDKDPRDLFLVENLYNGSRYIPFEDVKIFVQWYKETRSKAKFDSDSNNVYFCKLNELVYEYDSQCRKIEEFLCISSSDHKNKLTKFIPEKSSTNIELYNKFNNYFSEIVFIKKELEDFIYTNEYKSGKEKITFNTPIVDVLKICDEIEYGKVIPNKLHLSLFSTSFYKILLSFHERKSLLKLIKGLIKIFICFLIFIPEYIYNLIIINS